MTGSTVDRILDKLDRIDTKVDDHARSLAGLRVKVDYLATREDVSTAIDTHVRDKHKSSPPAPPVNWRKVGAFVGALVATAITALGGGYLLR